MAPNLYLSDSGGLTAADPGPATGVGDNLPKMNYRFLGASGLYVSMVGLGLVFQESTDSEPKFACIKAAYDAGINIFECTERRSQRQSEQVLGEAIRLFGWHRCDLVISVKFHCRSNSGRGQCGLSRKHIIESMNASLKRLGLEYIDLVYADKPNGVTSMEEIVRAFNHLIDTGKAFYWGTSEWAVEEITDAWRVAEKFGLTGPLVMQQYSIAWRERDEKDYAPLYAKHGLGLITQSSFQVISLKGPRDEGLSEAIGIKPIAEKLGTTGARLALARQLVNKHVSSVVIGMSLVEEVHENLQALKIFPLLTPEIINEIDAVGTRRGAGS